MAFIVEDGSIVDNSNSYATVAEADQYAVDIGEQDWGDLSTEEKETALIKGTAYIDATYRSRWIGNKRTQDQSLSWSRGNAYDEDGWLIPSDQIPTRLKYSIIEMAFVVNDDPTIDLYSADSSLATVKRQNTEEKVDVIETKNETEYFGNDDASTADQTLARFAQSKVYLQGLLVSSVNGRVDRA